MKQFHLCKQGKTPNCNQQQLWEHSLTVFIIVFFVHVLIKVCNYYNLEFLFSSLEIILLLYNKLPEREFPAHPVWTQRVGWRVWGPCGGAGDGWWLPHPGQPDGLVYVLCIAWSSWVLLQYTPPTEPRPPTPLGTYMSQSPSYFMSALCYFNFINLYL